jgi:hypothetical protein
VIWVIFTYQDVRKTHAFFARCQRAMAVITGDEKRQRCAEEKIKAALAWASLT